MPEGLKIDKSKSQHEQIGKQTVQQKMKNAETPEMKHHQNMLGSGQTDGQQLNSDKLARNPQKLDSNTKGSKEQQEAAQSNPDFQAAEALINQLALAKRNNGGESNLLGLLESFLKAYGNTNTVDQFNPSATFKLIQGLKNLNPGMNGQDIDQNNGQPAPKSSSNNKKSDCQTEQFNSI